MSGKIRHVDLYPDEWLTGTASLDPVEIGIYITACAMIYSHGGPIPKSELRLRIRCHGHTFNRAYGRLVELGKLTEEDGEITNKRCANELQKAQERTAKAQQNGGKGGRPRNENKDIAKPDGSQAGKLTTNHQPPTTNTPLPPKGGVIDFEFAEFWRSYPRRDDRKNALKAFKRARAKAEQSTIVAAAKSYAAKRAGQDPQYTALATTWLNGERWSDEAARPAPRMQDFAVTAAPGPRPTNEELKAYRVRERQIRAVS